MTHPPPSFQGGARPLTATGDLTTSILSCCDVWLLAEDDVDEVGRVLDAQHHLSVEELERWHRLIRPASRRRHLGARILARWALSRYLGLDPGEVSFVRDATGRPSLAPHHPPLDFNLTHTEGVIGCAVVPTGRVGLDAETYPARAEAARLVGAVLTPRERARLDTGPPEGRLALLAEHWVIKEAYTKALGLGLRHPFDSFEIRDIHTSPVIHDPRAAPLPRLGLSLTLMHSKSGHVMAVATAPTGDGSPLRLHLIDAALVLTGSSGATAAVLPREALVSNRTSGASKKRAEVSCIGQSDPCHPQGLEGAPGAG